MLYAADAEWWHVHGDEVAKSFLGERWSCEQHDTRPLIGVSLVRVADHEAGLSRLEGTVNSGGNSGHQAVGLAELFGARRIVLLGYDFGLGADGAPHWHGVHTSGLRNPSANALERWRPRMQKLAADLQAAGIEAWNCSRATALDCFPRCSLDEALSE